MAIVHNNWRELQGVYACIYTFVVSVACVANAAPHSSSAFGVLLSDDIPLIKSSCSLLGCSDRAHVLVAELSDIVCLLLFILKSSNCYTCDCLVFCPGLHLIVACCHHASVGESSRLTGEKTEREAVSVFFFFSDDSMSTYTLLLIYSNCGETACAYCKSKGFSKRYWMGFSFLRTFSHDWQADGAFLISTLFIPTQLVVRGKQLFTFVLICAWNVCNFPGVVMHVDFCNMETCSSVAWFLFACRSDFLTLYLFLMAIWSHRQGGGWRRLLPFSMPFVIELKTHATFDTRPVFFFPPPSLFTLLICPRWTSL